MGRRKKTPNIDIQLDPAEIGKRAHQKWIDRGCDEGFAQRDWLEAEAELRAEKAAACVVAYEVKDKKQEELKLGFKVEEKVGEPQVDPTLQSERKDIALPKVGDMNISDLAGMNDG